MNTHKIEISKKKLLTALSDYYSKLYNTNIKVKEEHNIDYIGYYEQKTVNIRIYYEQKIEILGHTATETKEISLEDIKEIINEELNEKGYTIDNITYNSGIRDVEHLTRRAVSEEAYFEGIELQVAKKPQILSLKQERRN